MKKRLNDIFSISRNERIGLICLALILAIVISYTALSSKKNVSPVLTQQAIENFRIKVDSSQVDTIKNKKRKKRAKNQKSVKKSPTLTASALEEIETF